MRCSFNVTHDYNEPQYEICYDKQKVMAELRLLAKPSVMRLDDLPEQNFSADVLEQEVLG